MIKCCGNTISSDSFIASQNDHHTDIRRASAYVTMTFPHLRLDFPCLNSCVSIYWPPNPCFPWLECSLTSYPAPITNYPVLCRTNNSRSASIWDCMVHSIHAYLPIFPSVCSVYGSRLPRMCGHPIFIYVHASGFLTQTRSSGTKLHLQGFAPEQHISLVQTSPLSLHPSQPINTAHPIPAIYPSFL